MWYHQKDPKTIYQLQLSQLSLLSLESSSCSPSLLVVMPEKFSNKKFLGFTNRFLLMELCDNGCDRTPEWSVKLTSNLLPYKLKDVGKKFLMYVFHHHVTFFVLQNSSTPAITCLRGYKCAPWVAHALMELLLESWVVVFFL